MGSTDGFQYRALYPYRKEREEDIDLLPGDILVVSKGALQALGFKDGDEQTPNQIGWILGVNERTKQKGDFPGTYVEYVGPVKISVPSHRPRVQRPLPATPGARSPLPDLQEQFSPPEIAPPLLVKLVEAGCWSCQLGAPVPWEICAPADWTLGDLEPFDVHSLGEALRALPSCLVPSPEIPQPENCRKQLLLALESPAVPLQNTLTLQFLLRHLGKVSQQAESNSLHPRALGEIFGPLLLRLPVPSPCPGAEDIFPAGRGDEGGRGDVGATCPNRRDVSLPVLVCSQYSMMDDEEELPHHEERTWYVGKINRLQAEEMLCGKRDGTFLIRESSQKGCYACSHCVIYKTATGYGFAEPYNLYASLKDLVLHYKHTSLVQHNDSLNVTLAHPVLSQPPKRETPSSMGLLGRGLRSVPCPTSPSRSLML
uniref:Phosphatidylinositol 3-kinase regulatory subunit beta n=1 Tax=Athene cunicularia TaxID=194338 RepID=A0A663MXS7_ATHCN